jgi:peptide/nickel transport system substrate-binding protein
MLTSPASEAARLAPLLVIITLLAACAAPAGGPRGEPAPNQSRPAASKKLLAGIMGNPPTFAQKINSAGAGNIPGTAEVEALLNSGLSVRNDAGVQAPLLAASIPSVENGLWVLLPDGTMETTWKLRPDVTWHDGAPFTADDLLFTARIEQDRELALSRDRAFEVTTAFEAPNPHTLTVRWRQPYIYADLLFSGWVAPKHLLEATYLEDKESFTQVPHWSRDFVGTGPFKLKEWVQGSHAVLAANQAYPLGKARLDEIEVRFIPDSGTLIANILAGTVELTLGRSLSLDEGMRLQEQWPAGRMHPGPANTWIQIYPQFLNATPAVVTELPFRRALLHAVDRQDLADTIQGGLLPVAHSYVGPNEPEYDEVQRYLVKYEYDPRRSAQLMDELGYTHGSSGYVDSVGQRLNVELRTTKEDIHEKSMLAVADYWQRAGVRVDQLVIPQQRVRDQEYRANFPTFQIQIQSTKLASLDRFRASRIPLAENRWVGDNYPRYSNADLEGLIQRYFATVPRAERTDVLGQMMHHMTDRLVIIPMFHSSNPFMIAHRVEQVGTSPLADYQWNAHLWDVKPS